MKISALLLVFSVCQCMAAQVSLKQAAGNVLERISRSGYDKIYQFDVLALQDKLSDIQFSKTSGLFPQAAKNRRSAYYKFGHVYSPEEFDAKFVEAVELLALHEVLGAAGYDDEHYQRSSVLHIFSTDSVDKKALIQSPNMLFLFSGKENMIKQGGVTSVGGGGDLAAAWFKSKMLSYARDQGLSEMELLELSILAIEPDAQGSEPRLRMEVVDKPIAKVFDSFTISHFDREGRRGPISLSYVFEIPKDKGVKATKQSLRELLDFAIMSVSEKRESRSTCGAFELSLPVGFDDLDVVKRSGGVQPIIEKFKEHCANVYSRQ